MPKLRTLMLKPQYRSDDFDLARDFYAQCLRESMVFERAVGFFSSEVFATCSAAFADFFAKGGRIRLVTSHLFSGADLERIRNGLVNRSEFAGKDMLDELQREPGQGRPDLDKVVPWLVARDLLSVKVALIIEGRGNDIYHEKLGLFSDDSGETVAFAGSANESYQALQKNFELIDVYRSWVDDELRRVERKKNDFRRLWADETPGLQVMTFAEAGRKQLLREHSSGAYTSQTVEAGVGSVIEEHEPPELEGLEEVLHMPGHIQLYDHQRKAVRSWLLNKGHGVFTMATGSGKTITALASTTKLYELTGGPLVILVLCPYLHLLDQWIEEAKNFGLDPLECARGRDRWESTMRSRLYAVRSGRRRIASFAASNDTFRSEPFQHLLHTINAPFLLIGDEMHNLGATGLRRCLPENATYRLGLSATPERRYDPQGTQVLFQYFGQPVASYTLSDALKDGVLTPYVYYPHLVDLTEEELEEYEALTKRIGKAMSAGDDDENPALERLLIQRARLTASAGNKLPLLRQLMETRRNQRHTLVYCGDGRVEVAESEEEQRQIRAATRMLGSDLGMHVATYIAETPPDRRRQLLREFADGDIQALVAIRCLDEGVDVPATRQAFILASVTDPRQYVQRRGRVLRRAPGKDQAEVHDFLVAPPVDHQKKSSPYYQTTRRLFGRELERAAEFAELAENGPEAMGMLLDTRDRLDLLSHGMTNDEATIGE